MLNQAEAILEKRHHVMMQACQTNSIRFNFKAPKLQQLPEAVYIAPPENNLDLTPYTAGEKYGLIKKIR